MTLLWYKHILHFICFVVLLKWPLCVWHYKPLLYYNIRIWCLNPFLYRFTMFVAQYSYHNHILHLQMKCLQYWPENENEVCTFGNINIKLVEVENYEDYDVRTYAIKKVKYSINHCQYSLFRLNVCLSILPVFVPCNIQ